MVMRLSGGGDGGGDEGEWEGVTSRRSMHHALPLYFPEKSNKKMEKQKFKTKI